MEIVGNYCFMKNKTNQLGYGSYSIVYKGSCYGNNGNYVAIKVIDTVGANPKTIEMINNEINIMNMIGKRYHPNIVKCYDTYVTHGVTYIVMELCDSGDLQSIMNGPMKEDHVKYYFCQFINGLKFLHTYNIIHRDIKPKNILLTNKRKELKLADFGFAKVTSRNSLHESICGSPLYMSPEILSEEAYGDLTDLWSVGMILYEMLYGIHPFNHCTSRHDLKNQIFKTQIDIPNYNMYGPISQQCLCLLKQLLQVRSCDRISWNNFFNNGWINYDRCDMMSYSPSPSWFGGLSVLPDVKKSYCDHINIIDDYVDDGPIIRKIVEITDDCIFEMDFS